MRRPSHDASQMPTDVANHPATDRCALILCQLKAACRPELNLLQLINLQDRMLGNLATSHHPCTGSVRLAAYARTATIMQGGYNSEAKVYEPGSFDSNWQLHHKVQ